MKRTVQFPDGEVAENLPIVGIHDGRKGRTYGYAFRKDEKYLCVLDKSLVGLEQWSALHVIHPFDIQRDEKGAPDLVKTLVVYIQE